MSDLSRSCSGFPPLADPLQVEALSKSDGWWTRRNFKAIGFEILINENTILINNTG